MIYNKSAHPVEVKKISIRLWSLRDEIEASIARRMKECEAAGVPLYIEDIKRFYNLNMQAPLAEAGNVFQLHAAPKDDMSSLMESIGDEAKQEGEESQTLSEADKTIAEQESQGLETKKPNPILDRPYQRQAPDLDRISYGFTFLSDMHMESFLSFTKDRFLEGQSVVVEFLIPQAFMMTADVTYCLHFALRSRIISSTKPDYRVQCRFSFTIPGERDNLRSFLKSIEPTLPDKKKKDSSDDSPGL